MTVYTSLTEINGSKFKFLATDSCKENDTVYVYYKFYSGCKNNVIIPSFVQGLRDWFFLTKKWV